jgi:hypothetical protein
VFYCFSFDLFILFNLIFLLVLLWFKLFFIQGLFLVLFFYLLKINDLFYFVWFLYSYFFDFIFL